MCDEKDTEGKPKANMTEQIKISLLCVPSLDTPRQCVDIELLGAAPVQQFVHLRAGHRVRHGASERVPLVPLLAEGGVVAAVGVLLEAFPRFFLAVHRAVLVELCGRFDPNIREIRGGEANRLAM